MNSSTQDVSVGANVSTAPRVSVLVPCYNTASFVAETLDSLWKQTYTDFEVVLVNDGSPDTDELERILEPVRDRIVYIVQENRGLSGARNTGLHSARGEYVALLDSDDYWHPRYLEVLVQELDSKPDLDVVFPDAMIFGDAMEAGRSMMQLTPFEGDVTFERLLTQECFVFVGVLARKSIIMEAGLFDERFRSSEDFELWLRILRAGRRIGYTREVLAYYRRRGDSLSANLDRMFMHHMMVWDKIAATMDLSCSESQLLDSLRERTRARQQLSRGRAAFFLGDFAEARTRLREANETLNSRKLSVVTTLLAMSPRTLLTAYRLRDRFLFRSNTKS
ncbi:MAG: glycosyltransferase family 2 protein [Gemmatimonadetes bacterium]|nr:glycosyltransferase family 2 protein [Gemmatimonadota bacterium]